MPLNVTVEKPDTLCISSALHIDTRKGTRRTHTWIIGSESNHEVSVRVHHEYVSANGRCCKVTMMTSIEEACVSWRAIHYLEVVSVKMEWMLSGVVVIEDDLHNVTLFQHVAVSIVSVNGLV